MIEGSRAWQEAFPQTFFAVLAMEGIENGPVLGEMEARKSALGEKLRQLWQGKTCKDLKAASPFGAYESHYRRFGQGYPVLAQVESVALKGKPIASVSPLVTALFTVYGVPSVTKEKIRAHLEETERLLRVISLGAATTALAILP